jgi:hypothetical protein
MLDEIILYKNNLKMCENKKNNCNIIEDTEIYSMETTENILLQSSKIRILTHIYDIHKYKLEIYTNGNIKIINKTLKKDYFYINDYIELIPSIINMHTFLFATIL